MKLFCVVIREYALDSENLLFICKTKIDDKFINVISCILSVFLNRLYACFLL